MSAPKNIHRRRLTCNYTQIPNEILHDAELSWKAKGLLAFLISLPQDWEVSASHVKNKGKDGVDSVYAGINELCEAKYLWKRRRGGADAGGWEYVVYDIRTPEDPFGEIPIGENPYSGKSPSTNNVHSLNKERMEERKEVLEIKGTQELIPQQQSESERGLKFADWFRSTLSPTQKLSRNWRVKWAKKFDDIIRLDNRTPEEIFAVCKWARNDEFWKANFMSPGKLREKKYDVQYFDKFKAAMNARPSSSFRKSNGMSEAENKEISDRYKF